MGIIKRFSEKLVAMAGLILYIVSCIPVVYVGFFNYATGDDLLYGSVVKRAIAEGDSLSEILVKVIRDVVSEYYSFQGTWSSQLVWRFEPSIWGERAYFITVFLSLGTISIGTFYILHIIMVREMKMGKWGCLATTCFLLFYSVQYMPYPRGGVYWFTGMLHYTVAYGLALLAVGFTIEYIESGYKRYAIGIIIIMAYMGGTGYPAIVISGIGVFFGFIWALRYKKNKPKVRKLLIVIALLLEMIGFVISAVAPGNSVRGGEDYGFSLGRIGYVFVNCFTKGISDLFKYFFTVRALMLLPIIVLTVSVLDNTKVIVGIRDVLAVAVAGIFLICMTRSPEIYAGTTVKAGISGGVYDSYFYVSLLFITVLTLCIGLFIKQFLPVIIADSAFKKKSYFGLSVFVILFWGVLWKHLIGNSLDYSCYKYVGSGQLADYEDQMQQRIEILNSASDDEEVVLPFINDDQGPLMHMAITEDANNYTNSVTARFYGKKMVVGMNRTDWEQR